MDPVTMQLLFSGVNYASQQQTNQLNVQQNERNNQMQVFLQNQQNQFNQRMWEQNNQYNSPQSQMQRLRNAGLNPGLAYGGNVANVSQGQVQQQSKAQTIPSIKQAPQFDSQVANVLLQQRQLDQQENVNKSIIDDNKASARLKNSEALRNETKQPFVTLNEQAQLDLIQTRIDEMTSNITLNDVETDLRSLSYDFNSLTFPIRFKQQIADYNLTVQQAKTATVTALYYKALTAEANAKTQYTYEDQRRVRQEIELVGKRIGLTDAEITESQNKAEATRISNQYQGAKSRAFTNDEGELNTWGYISELLNPSTGIAVPIPTNNNKTTTVKHKYPKKIK